MSERLGPQFGAAVESSSPPPAEWDLPGAEAHWSTLQQHHRVNSDPDAYQRALNEQGYHRVRWRGLND
jgi:hypothetical protein